MANIDGPIFKDLEAVRRKRRFSSSDLKEFYISGRRG
jgi:hypothetical protein